jgi:site-specific recombinase XerC
VSKFFGLKLEELDLNQNLMKVFGKGAKERQIPIGSKVVASNVEESTEYIYI